MAEVLEDDRHSDPDARASMRRELSQAISRRQNSITPRVAVAEVCDKVYRLNMSEDEENLESTASLTGRLNTSQEKRKLVIILVGLPGRGKTYLCNKLICYLNWCDFMA
jgi:signal recognition particle GTPase